MNEKSKVRMLEQKKRIIESLESHFPSIPLFEDEIAEDEEDIFVNSVYLGLVLMMGDFQPANPGTLTQTILIDYYSENRDDVDETLIDVISLISRVPTIDFVRTNKMRMRVGDSDRFVDIVTLEFRRLVKYE